jgi:hypothetical protein
MKEDIINHQQAYPDDGSARGYIVTTYIHVWYINIAS